MASSEKPGTVIPVDFVKPDSPGQAVVVLNESDDVAVALRALKPGEEITLPDGQTLNVSAAVPKGHKVALRTINKGLGVKKYAQLIGFASTEIAGGEHIHTHNLEFRNTDQNYDFSVDKREPPAAVGADSFDGFLRQDGRAGTRNYIAVISSVNCSATAARFIADHFSADRLATYENVDGVVAFTHATGCGLADSGCLLYTSPSPRDKRQSRMPSSA